MPTLKNGLLIDPKVHQRVFPGLEKGPLNSVNALVIHQTGAPTAQHTFNSYQKSSYGAHFLIDKSGKVYQTASLEKKAYHVGKIKSKCYENNNCKKAELQTVTSILFAQGKRYSTRISNLHSHEKAKPYPD
ncbi:N-acetylmuramoyl-L-alanine amidase [Microbulbifer halophilus]|uniref:N-acetylmuramoyl-L-alanine amidase n=1 Tax=Microbulbifer halophilus TaxID=453963 RepID=A0ABW5E7M7_9GAMM